MGLNHRRAGLQPAALPSELRKRGAQGRSRTFKLLFLRQVHVPILLPGRVSAARSGSRIRTYRALE